jgi:hypothetical protein
MDEGIVRVGERVVVYSGTAGGLAEDGYARGIAAERRDIAVNPFDGEALVEEANVIGDVRVAWEAEDIGAEAGEVLVQSRIG